MQAVQEHFRALRDGLESRIQERLPMGHAINPWLVAQASDTLSRYRIWEDGATSHERWKGKKFRRVVPGIRGGSSLFKSRSEREGQGSSDMG